VKVENAAAYARDFGFKQYYTDFQEMLKVERPDAVCSVVSEAFTCQVVSAILEAGYPVLTEKPPGKTLAELDRLARAAEKSRTPCMVAFNRRYMTIVEETRRHILEKEAEKKQSLFLRYDFFRKNRHDADFSDTAIHAIDCVRHLSGSDYASVQLHYQAVGEGCPENVYLDALMKSGLLVRINVLPNCGLEREEASVFFQDETLICTMPLNSDGDKAHHYLSHGFYRENELFFDRVKAGSLDWRAFEEARNTMRVKECYEQRRPGLQPPS
jgi:predicted dehydrogenase